MAAPSGQAPGQGAGGFVDPIEAILAATAAQAAEEDLLAALAESSVQDSLEADFQRQLAATQRATAILPEVVVVPSAPGRIPAAPGRAPAPARRTPVVPAARGSIPPAPGRQAPSLAQEAALAASQAAQVVRRNADRGLSGVVVPSAAPHTPIVIGHEGSVRDRAASFQSVAAIDSGAFDDVRAPAKRAAPAKRPTPPSRQAPAVSVSSPAGPAASPSQDQKDSGRSLVQAEAARRLRVPSAPAKRASVPVRQAPAPVAVAPEVPAAPAQPAVPAAPSQPSVSRRYTPPRATSRAPIAPPAQAAAPVGAGVVPVVADDADEEAMLAAAMAMSMQQPSA